MNTDHAQFGDDLKRLIARQASTLVAAEELTTIRSPRQGRASFRLTFDDGQVLKGRRFRTLERCQVAATLMPLLSHLPLNTVIDSCGDSWLEEWIPGTPLAQADTTPALCRWAGDLMGRIHAVRVDSVAAVPPAPGLDEVLNTLEINLVKLREAGAISPGTSDALRSLAAEERPREQATGLIHTDLSVENFIVDQHDGLHVIDNEHMTLGALEYDLAKTFCRWPMTAGQRAAFCAAYAIHREDGWALADSLFWPIIALAQSTRVRSMHDQPCQPMLWVLESLASGQSTEPWPTLSTYSTQTA